MRNAENKTVVVLELPFIALLLLKCKSHRLKMSAGNWGSLEGEGEGKLAESNAGVWGYNELIS